MTISVWVRPSMRTSPRYLAKNHRAVVLGQVELMNMRLPSMVDINALCHRR